MKNFKAYKEKFIKTYQYLNDIDFNSFVEKLKNTNLSDIKNLNSKDIISYLKSSNYLKPILGFLIIYFWGLYSSFYQKLFYDYFVYIQKF